MYSDGQRKSYERCAGNEESFGWPIMTPVPSKEAEVSPVYERSERMSDDGVCPLLRRQGLMSGLLVTSATRVDCVVVAAGDDSSGCGAVGPLCMVVAVRS